jgi:hypothetical protein
METIMSKTNDTSRELTSNELDAVSGGRITNTRVNATPVHLPPSQVIQASGAASPSVTVNGGPLAFA